MKSENDNISSHEWWWVAVTTGFLVTLTLLPYAWALFVSDDVYQFMGVLSNPRDGATYISKILQGVDGAWLFELRHTPQPHEPAGFHLFYLALGHAARLLGLSTVVIFHLARVITSIFMFFAFYQLGATIWQRQRPRRVFFMLLAIGGGLGWLALTFGSDDVPPDIAIAEGFPFLAAYTNPHFPLAIGCMVLATSHLLLVFRPGYDEAPRADNGGALLLLLGVLLSIISPPAMVVLGGVLVTYTVVQGISARQLPLHQVRWTAMLLLPALPFAFYYLAVFEFNDVFGRFNEQNITLAPPVSLTLASYSILLMIAIPGLVRAVRRFEPDGDQLMLIWLVVNSIAIYFPEFALQRRLYIGLIIPIVYFAVRSMEDYWFDRVGHLGQRIAFVLIATLILPTHFISFFAPLFAAALDREVGADTGIVLQTDYIDAFNWLENNAARDEVVVSAPAVGLWVPARTPLRPFYGHDFETVPADIRLEQLRAFYRGEDCDIIFTGTLSFDIEYVLWGPSEEALGLFDAEEDNIDEVFGENLPFDFEDEDDLSQLEVPLPTADVCQEQVEDRAVAERTFGDVTLYTLDVNAAR